MGFNKLIRFAIHHHNQKLMKRKFHCSAEINPPWRGHLREGLERGNPKKSEHVCIYRIPPNMLHVEPKAYIPNNIAIGPYHHGRPHLKDMEDIKLRFFRRLFDPAGPNGSNKLDEAFKELESIEDKARQCYAEEIKFSSDEFLEMMMVDSSFIIQLLREFSELEKNKLNLVPDFSRWMLPAIRREMIMLENQIPQFILRKLFEITNTNGNDHHSSVDALALKFFHPMLKPELGNYDNYSSKLKLKEPGFESEHLVDLFRYSIRPTEISRRRRDIERGIQTNMIYSATQLDEAGVKIKKRDTTSLLDISFGNKFMKRFVKELKIPTLRILDHRATALRNMVAFEKCHNRCHADVTAYVFFFNRLINSSKDVDLLHQKGVVHHSLGCDEELAELINKIAKEIVPDSRESYLYRAVNEANEYVGDNRYAKMRASMVRNYFTSWVVGVTTAGAVFALVFTVIQTICAVYQHKRNGKSLITIFLETTGFISEDDGGDDNNNNIVESNVLIRGGCHCRCCSVKSEEFTSD
ncbi:hypothetical protein PIB30_024324 [Stylosanthes scabra]|uniref:Uncharacterized protein n=1 Tax=Stylosanthes scabra TaxID=79078 RepID=A0ABU6Y8B8_9FABA|nr:hypothetical protein [Stylosanthes scabra]